MTAPAITTASKRAAARSERVATIAAAFAAAVLLASGCDRDAAPSSGPPAARDPFVVTPALRAAAVASTDVEAMLDAATAMQGWHAHHATGLAPALRGGVPLAELDAIEAGLGCRFPDDLRALWRWRDGHEDIGTVAFSWYHRLLPVHEAVAQYRDAGRLPVLAFEGETWFVECGAERVAASPLLFHFDETGTAPAYASLTTYFATMADAMADGTIRWSATDGMDADLRALSATHARHNPGLAFPYAVPDEEAK